MTQTATAVEHTVSDGFEHAIHEAGPIVNHAAQAGMNDAVAVTNAARYVAAHGVDNAQAAANGLVDSVQVRATGAVDSIQQRVNAALDSTVHVAGGAVDTAQRLGNQAVDSAQRLANGGIDSAQRAVNAAIDRAQANTLGALDRLPGPFGRLAGLASSAVDGVQHLSTSAVDGGQTVAKVAVDDSQKLTTNAVNKVQTLDTRAIDGLQNGLDGAIDTSQKALSTATDVSQRLGTAAVDDAQAAAAAQARLAQQAAIAGLNTAGAAVRPEALAGLTVAHALLTQHNGDQKFDGDLIGAGGTAYPPGTPLSDVPGVLPANGVTPTETLLYVNGISTTEQAQASDLQKIADATGDKVIGLHNSTDGFLADGAQVFTDKLAGKNSAVSSLADTVYAELEAGHSVHLMAHSQGGLVSSRALSLVKERLMKDDGLSRADAEQRLSNVTLETFAAAARNYPDGPKYIHTINRLDVVPGLLGLGPGVLGSGFDSHPGRGAVTRYFTGDLLAHGLLDQYLSHRQAP